MATVPVSVRHWSINRKAYILLSMLGERPMSAAELQEQYKKKMRPWFFTSIEFFNLMMQLGDRGFVTFEDRDDQIEGNHFKTRHYTITETGRDYL